MSKKNYSISQQTLYDNGTRTGSVLNRNKSSRSSSDLSSTLSSSTSITPRTNQYSSAMTDAINKLNSIEKFSYNQKDDPLYNQYAEMYQKNAKLAMQDTVGQAAALTGGYGSSYAETAGQAMYNQNMSQLNDKALELYNASLDAYNSYADLAAQQANTAISAFSADQSAINTELNASQWNAEFAENQRQYDSDLAYKYSALAQDQSQYDSDLAYKYASLAQDQSQYESNLAYQKQRDSVSDEQYASDLAYKYANLGYNYDATTKTATMTDYTKAMQDAELAATKASTAATEASTASADAETAYKFLNLGYNYDKTTGKYTLTDEAKAQNDAELAYTKAKTASEKASAVTGDSKTGTTASTGSYYKLDSDTRKTIVSTASRLSSDDDKLANYINGLVDDGVISANDAVTIYNQYTRDGKTTKHGGGGGSLN